MTFSKILLISLAIAAVSVSAISCTSTKNAKNSSLANANGSAASTSKLELYTVYFDFDKYNVRADQQDNASAMAHSISAYTASHPNLKVQVQGNTDDRGSVEYNMALGTKRAEALKDYLVKSGVNPEVLDTVSYGKERPAVQGADEVAWSQNRRDDVVLLQE